MNVNKTLPFQRVFWTEHNQSFPRASIQTNTRQPRLYSQEKIFGPQFVVSSWTVFFLVFSEFYGIKIESAVIPVTAQRHSILRLCSIDVCVCEFLVSLLVLYCAPHFSYHMSNKKSSVQKKIKVEIPQQPIFLNFLSNKTDWNSRAGRPKTRYRSSQVTFRIFPLSYWSARSSIFDGFSTIFVYFRMEFSIGTFVTILSNSFCQVQQCQCKCFEFFIFVLMPVVTLFCQQPIFLQVRQCSRWSDSVPYDKQRCSGMLYLKLQATWGRMDTFILVF